MAARTRPVPATGIALEHDQRLDTWTVTRTGRPAITVHQVAPSLDDCSAAAGLRNGYWLKRQIQGDISTWQWVQL